MRVCVCVCVCVCACVLLAGGIRIHFSSGSFRIIENLILPFDEHIFFFATTCEVHLDCLVGFITLY